MMDMESRLYVIEEAASSQVEETGEKSGLCMVAMLAVLGGILGRTTIFEAI